MATMNISLPQEMKDFIEECVKSGKYANSSDYVRDVIRDKIMEKEKAIEELQALVDEAEASGPAVPWDVDAFLKKMHKLANERDSL